MKRAKRSSLTSSGTGSGQLIGFCSIHRAVLEATDAIQLRLVEKIEQQLEIFLGLAGEADNEGRTQGDLRADCAPGVNALQRPLDGTRSLHQLEDAGAGVLQWNIQIGQDLALSHQGDHVIHIWIWVDIMQADPQPQFFRALHTVPSCWS